MSSDESPSPFGGAVSARGAALLAKYGGAQGPTGHAQADAASGRPTSLASFIGGQASGPRLGHLSPGGDGQSLPPEYAADYAGAFDSKGRRITPTALPGLTAGPPPPSLAAFMAGNLPAPAPAAAEGAGQAPIGRTQSMPLPSSSPASAPVSAAAPAPTVRVASPTEGGDEDEDDTPALTVAQRRKAAEERDQAAKAAAAAAQVHKPAAAPVRSSSSLSTPAPTSGRWSPATLGQPQPGLATPPAPAQSPASAPAANVRAKVGSWPPPKPVDADEEGKEDKPASAQAEKEVKPAVAEKPPVTKKPSLPPPVAAKPVPAPAPAPASSGTTTKSDAPLRSTQGKRIVVLISGSGSNLQALMDATVLPSGPLSGATISLVLSNRKAAYGLERARGANPPIPTTVLALKTWQNKTGGTREEYDEVLARHLLSEFRASSPDVPSDAVPDLIVLAGFMHIVSERFLAGAAKSPIEIINLHPAKPGAFDGAHAIERAYAAWQAGEIGETGVMVHHVIPAVDRGTPILVRSIPIREGDSLDDLETRMHATEHEVLVEAAALVLGLASEDKGAKSPGSGADKLPPPVRAVPGRLPPKPAAKPAATPVASSTSANTTTTTASKAKDAPVPAPKPAPKPATVGVAKPPQPKGEKAQPTLTSRATSASGSGSRASVRDAAAQADVQLGFDPAAESAEVARYSTRFPYAGDGAWQWYTTVERALEAGPLSDALVVVRAVSGGTGAGSVGILASEGGVYVLVPPQARKDRLAIRHALVAAQARARGQQDVHVLLGPSRVPAEIWAAVGVDPDAEDAQEKFKYNVLTLERAQQQLDQTTWDARLLAHPDWLPLGVDPSDL